jgi:hypothetical protein
MTPKNPPVGMGLINNNIFEIGKKFYPPGMIGKHPGVEHIRIGDNNTPRVPGGHPERIRGIPVINRGLDRKRNAPYQFVKLRLLVLGKSLGGKQVKGPGLPIFKKGLENGKIITKGLSRRRRGNHHHAAAPPEFLKNPGLVGINSLNTPQAESGGYTVIQALGKIHVLTRSRGKQPLFHNMGGKRRIIENSLQILPRFFHPFPRRIYLGKYRAFPKTRLVL